jgi:predicted Abi (CAAX) family protease
MMPNKTLETYIIRIYRRIIGRPEEITGVSEHVETGDRRSFGNMQQLSDIILKVSSRHGKLKKTKRLLKLNDLEIDR